MLESKTKTLTIAILCLILTLLALANGGNVGSVTSMRSGMKLAAPTIIQDPPPSPVTNFPIPSSSSTPTAIVTGANNLLWFTESRVGKIGVFNETAGSVTKEYQINETGATPATIAIDKTGLVWFADENTNSPGVWYLDPASGTFHRYATSTSGSEPFFVMVDPSTQNIWFTDSGGNYIGEISNSTRAMTRYFLPNANSVPYDLARENATSYLWITEGSGKLARFDMVNGQNGNPFQEFTPPVPLTYPVGIVVDRFHNVWVSEHGGSSITEFIQSNSTWRKYPTSQAMTAPGTGPATLTIDKLGRLWFAEHYVDRIGRLDPSTGVINEWNLPIQGAYSILATIDPQGNFWFTESGGNSIGRILGSATFPIAVDPTVRPSGPVTSGTSTTAQFMITNGFPGPVQLRLNVTSFFTSNYYTTSSEVSLSTYALSLNPGESRNITATVTPDFSLPSGTYTVGLVASYNNVTSVRTFFLQVSTSPWYQLETALPDILIAAGIVLVMTFLLFRQRKKRRSAVLSRPVPKISLAAVAVLLLLFLIQQTGETSAKCPGLPPPPGNPGGNTNSPDYYGIALDIGSIAFFAIVAYLLIRSRFQGPIPPTA